MNILKRDNPLKKMHTNIKEVYNLEPDIPEHLAGLKECHDKSSLYIDPEDDKKYAETLKCLIQIKTDKNGADINKIIEYMENIRERNGQLTKKWINLMNDIRSWLMWAKIWTDKKVSK